MLSNDTAPSEFTIKAIREFYGLDPLAVQPHAQRPKCKCGRNAVGHSYHHLATELICHHCLYGTPYVVRAATKTKKKGNRWVGYKRPDHKCLGCGAILSENKVKRCRSCAAKEREGRRAK